VAVNCAAIPDSLIESELFGYLPGTFTGGRSKGMKGLIAQADRGTLFLDEIGDMPMALQTRLLRVLSDIGGTVAEAIAEFFAEEKNQREIDALLAAGVAPQGEHPPRAQLREKLEETKLLAALGIPRKTFYDKLKRHDIDVEAYRPTKE